ncbi:hypothetical protein ACFC3F_06695 [Microbacterium sp. NPDC055910]|uniref:hypothetical protein n=1 Tax=Microbacterium sp. NPDC055910 TaxID=3345659 RepID=UPI0035DF3755
MDVGVALLSGLVAGFALAIPLGAIGVLLVQEGATQGGVRGLTAAAGVATTDVILCAVAVAAGSTAAPVIAGWAPWPHLAGGCALVAIGAWRLVQARRSAGLAPADEAGTSARRFALFVGLTVINPTTVVYFAAVATAITEATSSWGNAVAFVLAVGGASFAWQALLVSVGAVLRTRSTPRLLRLSPCIGNGVVVALGVAVGINAALTFAR